MEKKQRAHKFFDKHTILGAILLMIIGMLGGQLLGSLIGLPLTLLSGEENIGIGIGAAAVSFLLLLLYKRWFRPEFEGNLRGGDLKLGCKLSIIMVAYWVISFALTFAVSDYKFAAPTISSICLAIMAGTSEEVAFRGLPLSYLMRQWKDEKHIPIALLFTSAVFGIIHLINVIAGGNPGSVVMQTITAFGAGIIFGAIYLRSGNLLVTIILHILQDIIAFTDAGNVKDGIVVGSVNIGTYIDVVLTAILAIIGLWLIRPSKRAEIRALWNKKWGIASDRNETLELHEVADAR